MVMQGILKKLRDSQVLSPAEMTTAINSILQGQNTPSQIGAFLMALSQRGESVDEIVAAANVLRQQALTLSSPKGAIDCCGTGGDHSGSYNISTAVAFVVSACGVPVAKHGNRAASSLSGAADVLESLGINLNISPAQCEESLTKFGFCFLMAPQFHQSLKPLSTLRKELGFRTIFNLLGPLANPAGTKHQLLGVFSRHWVLPMTQALQKLGSESAMVVHGSDGLDEITLCGDTYCAELKDGAIREFILSPSDFGLPTIKADDIRGGDATKNADALMKLLQGTKSAYRDIVLANASACLRLAGKTTSWTKGVKIAAEAIDEGRAYQVFAGYKDFSNSQSGG
jgi:anthranilate phosphoribosyltransferase